MGVELISAGGTARAQPGWCRSRAGGAPMGAGTEDAIGLEPVRHGGTAGSGTSPGYLAAPGQRLGITFDLFTTTHGKSRRLRGWLVAGAGTVLVGVYKINASNAMPKPYLTVYIYTYVRACTRGRLRTVLANESKRERK